MAVTRASSVCKWGPAFAPLPAAPRVVPSSGGGAAVRAPQPLAAAGQPPPQQQRRRQRPMRVVVRASKEDEMIERMKREAAGNDIWGNEVVSIVFKVAVVAVAVGAVVLLLDAAQPIVQTTVERFPTPAQ